MSARPILAAATALALVPALAAQSAVFVVDDTPGPGVNFADMPGAVAAAADGDILLVRDGTYSSFTVDAKRLTILADTAAAGGALPVIDGMVRVERLRFDQTVVIRGLETGASASNGLQLDANLGAVFSENCSWKGGDGFNSTTITSHPDGYNAVNITSCANVSFANCTLEAGDGAHLYDIQTDVNGRGGAGMLAIDSRVALFQCTLLGGNGGDDRSEFALSGNHGGPGGFLNRGLVHSSRSTFLGGRGGGGGVAWQWSGCGNGGNGGNGFFLLDGELAEVDTSMSGGRGGGGAAAYGCRNGFDGAPLLRQAGTHTLLPGGTGGDFEAPAPLRAGTTTNMPVRGQPGDLVVLAISLEPAFLFEPALSGVLLVGAQPAVNLLGTVPASGAMLIPLTHPGILRRGQGVLIHTQVAFLTTGGAAVLGPFSVAVLIGP